MTNWYSIFYWLTVADGVKQFFDTSSDLFTWFAVISFLGYMVFTGVTASLTEESKSKDDSSVRSVDLWRRGLKTSFIFFMILCLITWLGYIFTPTKKDALIIIAGGAVGNFVTQDTSARKIPAEVMNLLRVKIKDEINETSIKEAVGIETDTLKGKSNEELMQIIKSKK